MLKLAIVFAIVAILLVTWFSLRKVTSEKEGRYVSVIKVRPYGLLRFLEVRQYADGEVVHSLGHNKADHEFVSFIRQDVSSLAREGFLLGRHHFAKGGIPRDDADSIEELDRYEAVLQDWADQNQGRPDPLTRPEPPEWYSHTNYAYQLDERHAVDHLPLPVRLSVWA